MGTFVDAFNCMPIAAVVGKRILCMHGGPSPELVSLDKIRSIERPCTVPDFGILCDILWSDPEPQITGWGLNDRGVSFIFGNDVIHLCCKRFELDLICRDPSGCRGRLRIDCRQKISDHFLRSK